MVVVVQIIDYPGNREAILLSGDQVTDGLGRINCVQSGVNESLDTTWDIHQLVS
jgi:hypothetical protein